MSRTNPFVRKPRKANRTVLAIGEGKTEGAFLRFLKKRYCKIDNGIAVKIIDARGGDPRCVIDYAIKQTQNAEYDCVFVLLDADRPCPDTHKKKARKKNIELIWCRPCIESLLLQILEPGFDGSTKTAVNCKQLFETKYLDKKAKLEPENYEALFGLELLERRRSEISELNNIIKFMVVK